MTIHDISKKILAPTDVQSWRESIARAGGSVVVVAGSFDIFQPGNLLALRIAAQQASHVCVVIDTDERHQNRDWAWNSPAIRAESASHLRDAAAVLCLTADQAEHGFRDLSPYRLVDCRVHPTKTPLHETVRAMADSMADIPPVPGCFARDIFDRILRNDTPVPVDPSACAPLPGPAELDQLQRNRKGRTLVTVNGCFDILHLGHLRMLAQARQMGDDLVALINDDASVRAYKGPTRPVFPAAFRLTALNMLNSVSLAYPFSGDNPLSLIEQIRPDIHVKGGTYEEERVRQERELLESWGGHVEFCPLVEGHSTTDLISKARK